MQSTTPDPGNRGQSLRRYFSAFATLRLTAERDKNLSAASGVAYIRLGAILTSLAAPNLAPQNIRNQPTTTDALCPTTPFLGSCPEIDGAPSGSAVPMSLFRGSHRIAQNRSAWEFPVVSVKELTD